MLVLVVMILAVLGNNVRSVSATGLAVDGAVSNECSALGSCSVTLTTGSPNEVIIVFGNNGGGIGTDPFGTLTDIQSKLSFTSRTSHVVGDDNVEEWYAIASSALSSDIITLTAGTTNHLLFALNVWGIIGANTVTPFDPSAPATPNVGGGGSANVPGDSTSNANDMLLGLVGQSGTATWTAGSPFTLLDSPNTHSGAAEFEIVSSTQSGLTVSITPSPSLTWDMIVDAVQAAPLTPIPEYPLSISILALFMIVGYGMIRRKTQTPKNI